LHHQSDNRYASKASDMSLKLDDLNVFGIIVSGIDLWAEMNLPLT